MVAPTVDCKRSSMRVVILGNNMPISRLIKRVGSVTALLMLITPAVAMAGRGFYPDGQNIRSGMLVSATKNTAVVEAASDKNQARLVGVIGGSTNDYEVKGGQITVQTDGVVKALVSTIHGDIKVGDHISPSALVGFGAKSDGNSWVVGTAQGSFDAGTTGAVKSSVTDADGTKHEVYVGSISLLIKVTQEKPATKSGEQATKQTNKFQAYADSVAGKKASNVAVALSFVILVIGLLIAGIIVNTSVRSGITSTARQPLAKQAIFTRMLQSIGIAVFILAVSVAGSVIILRII